MIPLRLLVMSCRRKEVACLDGQQIFELVHGFVSPSAARAAHQKHAGIPVAMEGKQARLGTGGEDDGDGWVHADIGLYLQGTKSWVTEKMLCTQVSRFNPLLPAGRPRMFVRHDGTF